MGKIIETKVNRFDGGIVNDPRDPRTATARVVTNFDILTDPYRIKPYRDSNDGDDSATGNKIHNFCIAELSAGTSYGLYGLGISGTGTNRAKVFYKALTTGASNDLDDDDWNATAKPESAADNSGATESEVFIYYKRTGLLYLLDASNNKIMTCDPDGGDDWVETEALTHTFSSNAIIHSKDNRLYFGYYDKAGGANAKSFIAKFDGTTWTKTALTLPDDKRISSICEYGNYLAIGCETYNPTAPGFGESVVYLWDRDASLATLSESVYWGDDRLMILEEINGTLIGISLSNQLRFESKLVFRYLSVTEAIKFEEITSSSIDLIRRKQRVNNRLYFMSELNIDGESRDGVWSIGGRPGEFTIAHERKPNNDSTFTDLQLKGFIFAGDYLFQSYTDSAVYAIKKTNSSSSFTAQSVYEKQFQSIDSSTTKNLLGITASFEPLPTAGQVVLKYATDEKVDDNDFTTIFTHGTDDSIRHTAINIEATGVPLPQYKEIKFRIESTGGAVITGLKFREEVIDDDIIKYG